MPVAVITGASSGIGHATALLFASNGYSLSVTGRNEEALASLVTQCVAAGCQQDQILTTSGDLINEDVAKAVIQRTVEKFGRIDTLVSSAGILVNGRVEDSPLSEYDRQMNINVRSVVQITRFAIPHLVASKGTVVNVSSITGPCPFPGVTYYCMSKAALDQFTKCLALELAPQGVRVNAVNPGVIVTEVHKRAGVSDEDYVKFLEKGKTTHALGRVGEAAEVAEAILFLASPRSSFTTGELLRVDGGRGIMHPR